jgi:amidohydrolase
MTLIEPIVASKNEFTVLRRDLHAHPELLFEVHRTAALVKDKLLEWGIPTVSGIGKTGVVGTLKAGSSTRTIGLRADMDALPLQESNQFEHRSQNAGRMHACGHDGHTTMLLAAAKHLAATRNFDGTVHLIFQPAEEGGGAGAREMIRDGLFQRFACDAVFGLHNWPGMRAGRFGTAPGPVLASTSQFQILVHGKGGHAAMPHNVIDPIAVAAQIYGALQTIVSRNRKPIDAAVLSVSQFNAGSAVNIIPDDAVMRGTVRTFSDTVTDMIEAAMRRAAENTAAAYGASVEMTFQRAYPATVNHPAETAFALDVMRAIVGGDNVDGQLEPTMGGEDFAFMLRERPGCYAFIGNGDGAHRDSGGSAGPCLLHNSHYDFNDELIPLGATYWVRLTERWLAPG